MNQNHSGHVQMLAATIIAGGTGEMSPQAAVALAFDICIGVENALEAYVGGEPLPTTHEPPKPRQRDK